VFIENALALFLKGALCRYQILSVAEQIFAKRAFVSSRPVSPMTSSCCALWMQNLPLKAISRTLLAVRQFGESSRQN